MSDRVILVAYLLSGVSIGLNVIAAGFIRQLYRQIAVLDRFSVRHASMTTDGLASINHLLDALIDRANKKARPKDELPRSRLSEML